MMLSPLPPVSCSKRADVRGSMQGVGQKQRQMTRVKGNRAAVQGDPIDAAQRASFQPARLPDFEIVPHC
jgi:hypothetical protein